MSDKKLKTDPPIRNVIGWIQRGIKSGLIFDRQSVDNVFNYLRLIGFKDNKKYTNDKFMKAMQKIVRKKYKGYEVIKSIRHFIPNPHPNNKRRK